VNPNCQIILTVSPVPLAATMEPRHVLQSTVLSKSILRVAADEIERRYSHVHYFAAYEIITATLRSHLYYSADRRNVTPEGVSHVMKMFFQHFTDVPQAATDANADATGGAFLTVGTETETRCVDAVPTAPPELDVCDEYEIYRAFASRRDEK
jgi:hypothetical protein